MAALAADAAHVASTPDFDQDLLASLTAHAAHLASVTAADRGDLADAVKWREIADDLDRECPADDPRRVARRAAWVEAARRACVRSAWSCDPTDAVGWLEIIDRYTEHKV